MSETGRVCSCAASHPGTDCERFGCPPFGIYAGRGLAEELAELERTDPAVRAAAESFEQVKQQIIDGRPRHPLPCRDESCWWHHETTPASSSSSRNDGGAR